MKIYRHYLILVLLFTSWACNSQNISEQLPYPGLAAQRKQLSERHLAGRVRILDSVQIVTDIAFLASDTCEGRKPGTMGHEYAMQRIAYRMRAAKLDSFDHALIQPFNSTTTNAHVGFNVVGWSKGNRYPDSFIVVTAHYDHLGFVRGTFYGADDNASGVACLLAMAKYYQQLPHTYSMVFAAFDCEETGLQGAYGFVQKFVVSEHRKVKLNLNMDMIARSDQNEMYACGIRHYPAFKYLVTETANKFKTDLLMGHDYGSAQDDWTTQSDHLAFHRQHIPFLYLGVEDHPDYHRPTDTFNRINLSRYIENCNLIATILNTIRP